MDKMMDSPWFLRFTALFLAIILFFSVKVEEEKSAGKTAGESMDVIRDVPVEIYYDNENLVVTGVPETVDVTIEGPKNFVQTTKLLKDFNLSVDLTNLTMGEHTVRIQPENISEKLQVRIEPATVQVVIEEKITQTFRVDPEINERLLAEDFNVVSVGVLPTSIEVTGAKSVIEAISFVKATATGEQGIDESFEQLARVRVLDRDLNKLNVSINPEQVTVKVDVAEYNKEVPIVLKSRGTPKESVAIDSITTEADTITLFGSRKVLDQIKEFVVDVDVSDVKGQGTLETALKKPKGVSRMSLDKINVRVNATVSEKELEVSDPEARDEEEKEQVTTQEFQGVEVVVNGLDEKFTSAFQKPENGLVNLTVSAEQNVIEKLEKSDFVVSVDASRTTDEGEQVLAVSVEGPPGVNWKVSHEEVTIRIELA